MEQGGNTNRQPRVNPKAQVQGTQPRQGGQQAQQQAPQTQGVRKNIENLPPQEMQASGEHSTQNSLEIAEIRDGVVIMNDGSFRSVVICQSINFDLMSPEERESVEYAYQGFLNSLHFPIQIMVRSQKIDLDGYIQKLEKIRTNQENILLGLLMEDYIAYVQYLIEAANIMEKHFYVVVPYYDRQISAKILADNAKKLRSIFTKRKETITINEQAFNKAKLELKQRLQLTIGGLNQLGVQSIPLNTQELIELYYGMYNPQVANEQHLANPDDLDASIVSKGQGEAPLTLHGEES